jgi:hypothetical protein
MTLCTLIRKQKKSNLTPKPMVRKETLGKSKKTASPIVNIAVVLLPPIH